MTEHEILAALSRDRELRERVTSAPPSPASPFEVALIAATAFAVPAIAAWGAVGLALATTLGAALWLFERSRTRALRREGLLQLWQAIEDACCLDEVREAAQAQRQPLVAAGGRRR